MYAGHVFAKYAYPTAHVKSIDHIGELQTVTTQPSNLIVYLRLLTSPINGESKDCCPAIWKAEPLRLFCHAPVQYERAVRPTNPAFTFVWRQLSIQSRNDLNLKPCASYYSEHKLPASLTLRPSNVLARRLAAAFAAESTASNATNT